MSASDYLREGQFGTKTKQYPLPGSVAAAPNERRSTFRVESVQSKVNGHTMHVPVITPGRNSEEHDYR